MGESKRRKEALGNGYTDKSGRFISWLPVTKKQSQQFIELTSKGAWIGIGIMIALWITIRFIGPTFGWWEVY